MIITAQPFFNELDLLEIKCRELAGVVDGHVVVEARTTFTGLPKPLHFQENKERFAPWNVAGVVIDLPEKADSPWQREAAQYRAVLEAVRKINPEICIWVDADEVPRRDVVNRFRAMGVECATLQMAQLLFHWSRVDRTMKWTNGKIGYFNPACTHQPWRGETHWPILENAGWHACYFGGKERLLSKLSATSHAPEPGCQNMRRLVEANEMPGIERTDFYPREMLPKCVSEDKNSFIDEIAGEAAVWCDREAGRR